MKISFSYTLVIFFVVILFPVYVFCWTTPVNVSSSTIKSTMADLAIGNDGNIHVVWSEWWDPDLDHDIYYSYSTDNGNTWSIIENVCDDSHISVGPQIVVDRLNTVHIFWDDGYWSTPILWTYDSSGIWTEPIDIAEGSPGGEYLTAEIDSTNRIWVFWHEYGGQIWYAVYADSSWSAPERVTNETDDTAFPDAYVSADNVVHLVWKKYGDYYTDNDVYYIQYIDTAWTLPEKIESLPGQSCSPKIDMDSQNNPWVIWQERYSGYLLYHTHEVSNIWLPPTLISNEDRFIHDFVIDAGDSLHLFWTTGPLWYSVFNGVSWSTPIIISDTLAGNSGCEAVMIDNNNILHLLFGNAPRPGGDTVNIYHIRHNLTGTAESENRNKKGEKNNNYPNPFKKNTKIMYRVSKSGVVVLTLSDSSGRIIKEMKLGYKPEGLYSFEISQDMLKKGGDIHTGVYFYHFKSYGEIITFGKMIVIK